MHTFVLAALHWDPQIRGALILLTALLLLPGSVYLLLSTNTGARLGFLLAAAGLSGWIFVLALVWTMYGTGMKGTQPSWTVKEIVTGDLVGHAATPAVRDFPTHWKVVPATDPSLPSARAAADTFLIPPTTPLPGAKAKVPKFVAPFKTTQDYTTVAAYTKGGTKDNYLFRIGSYKFRFAIKHHEFYLKHAPHYFIVRVQQALPTVTLAGAAPTLPSPDVTQPIVTVVLVRDDGTLRQPNIFISVSAFLVFVVCCWTLHRRDKEIMRQRALSPAPA
jgi:hypothetical protein